MITDLRLAYKGAKIIETIENYSVAEESALFDGKELSKFQMGYYADEIFWRDIFRNPGHLWRDEIFLNRFVVSDWVARIPGLYWTDAARLIRAHTNSDIAFQSKEWIEFYPPGKSKKVLGGVGTLLLPPTDEGKILMSISSSCNASTGIPILVFPEVLDALRIKQGDCVRINGARWQPMDIQWSKHFATSKEVPRGYLVLDDIKKIEVLGGKYPVAYHPFSIMEYEGGDALLYDFVFASADTMVDNVDKEVAKFFDNYRKKEGRNGNYILNPNIVQPMFESRYSCPSELRHPSEIAKLNLLYQRVRDTHFNKVSIDLLVRELPKHYQSSLSIRALATRIGLNPALLSEDSAASMSAQLISLCIERSLIELLLDRMVYEYPEFLNNKSNGLDQ